MRRYLKTIFILVAVLLPVLSGAAAITSNVVGSAGTPALASAVGTWVGGVIPVNGDTIVVVNGAFVLQDYNLTEGSKTAGVGHAFTVNGTSNVTFGTYKVASGVTLTLRGFDLTTNTLGLVNRWAQFIPLPGSTVLGDVASDYGSIILNKGQIIANGTAGSHITFSVPTANLSATNVPPGNTVAVQAWSCPNNFSQVTATGGTSNTVTSAVNLQQGMNVTFSGTTTTVALRNQTYAVQYPGGTTAIVTPTMAGTPVAGDVFSTSEVQALTSPKYQADKNQASWLLDYMFISNAAGTGPGIKGDNSLVISAPTPTSLFTNEVASIALVLNVGDYYVDYDAGFLVWYQNWATTSNPTFTVTYNRLLFTAEWGIDTTQATTGNGSVFTYCDFQYMGYGGSAERFAVKCKGLTGLDPASSQQFTFQNCSMKNCRHGIDMVSCVGTASYPLLIDSNYFYNVDGEAGYGFGITSYRSSNQYLWITNNVLDVSTHLYEGLTTSLQTNNGFRMNGNTGLVNYLFYVIPNEFVYPDGQMQNNVLNINGNDNRVIQHFGGTSGHPTVISGNNFTHSHRAINMASYSNIDSNIIGYSYHHGLVGPTINNTYLTNVNITNNIFYGGVSGVCTYDDDFIDTVYNHGTWADFITIANNTGVGNGLISFGDFGDASTSALVSNLSVNNNISINATGGNQSFIRPVDVSTYICRIHAIDFDYNLSFNMTGGVYRNLNQQSTFMAGGARYNVGVGNSPAKTIIGASLWDPSYVSAPASKSLVYTVTALGSNETVAWDGGVAQQMITGTNGSGTVTSSANPANGEGLTGITGTLTVTGAAWPIAGTTSTYPIPNNTYNCPQGCYVKIITDSTTPASIGQVRAVTANSATVLTVVPGWTTLPSATATYAIYRTELQLFDSGTALTVGTGNSTTTLTCATALPKGTMITFGAGTTTVALRNLTYYISVASAAGGTATTATTMAGTPVNTDTFTAFGYVRFGAYVPNASWPTTTQTDTGITMVLGNAPTTNPLLTIGSGVNSSVATQYQFHSATSGAYHAGSSLSAPALDATGAARSAPFDIGALAFAASSFRRTPGRRSGSRSIALRMPDFLDMTKDIPLCVLH